MSKTIDINALEGEFDGASVMPAYDVQLLAQGMDHPLFGYLEPDDGRAYITYNICRAFPKVIGPESHGKYLGFHPKVLHRCHSRLVHKQNNLNHNLVKYGAYKDAIMGCVVGTAVIEGAATMDIPQTIEEAPSMQVCAVIFKNASGVKKMLGEHLTGKPWSVSIESRAKYGDSGVFDPNDRVIIPFSEIKGAMKNVVRFSVESGLTLGEYKGKQLAMAMGGIDGDAFFDGVGYTRNPAEDTAEITEVRASGDAGEFSVAACKAPDWIAGMGAKWNPVLGHGEGCGIVQEVVYQGFVKIQGSVMEASVENPVLKIRLAYSGHLIGRHVDSVSRV